MKVKLIDKHYLYLRDGGKCYFCGKALVYGKMSIDHYLPRSAGGTDELFNLVTSCKRCNGAKKNVIPSDVEKKHLEWFIQGVHARKILCVSGLKLDNKALDQIVSEVYKCSSGGEATLFESRHARLYVRENRITRVVYLEQGQWEEGL